MGNISQLQVYMLFTQYLFTTTVGFHMAPLIKTSHYMAWVCVLFGAVLGLAMTYGSYRLALRRPNQFLSEYGKDILGKWLHYPLMLFMILSSLLFASTILRQLLDLIIQVYLPMTPQWTIAALFGICLIYAVRSGIETIFRAAQGMFIFSLIGAVMFPFLIYRQIESDMVIALLNHFDIGGVWNGTYFMASLYGEMSFIAFLFPFFARNEQTMRSLSWATVTSVLIIIINLILTILIFGPELAANLSYPELELIRYANPRSHLANFDPALIAIWMSSLFIKISLFIFVAIIGLTRAFSLKDHKPFSLSLTSSVVVASLLIVGSTQELDRLLHHGIVAMIIVNGVIPTVYLIVDSIRGNHSKLQANQL